jgi:hypothetical protein
MSIPNQEALEERARNLGPLNGLRLVLVRLSPSVNPVEARLTVHFHNNNEIATILAATAGNPAAARAIFPVSGGRRVPAGALAGQVQTTAVSGSPGDSFLELTVKPIGDYSVYTLHVDHPHIDPVFASVRFKFRPGCFSVDCSPDWDPAPAPVEDPATDYLAKDYDSFRHTLMAAMAERVPGWRGTSEADQDQVLIDLLSATADELSDFQDRTVQEGRIGTARRRVSLARHARLVDYHIHQGNQASGWVALALAPGQQGVIPPGELTVRSGTSDASPTSQAFVGREEQAVHVLLNGMGLYTWSDAIPSLARGSTTADLKPAVAGQAAADTVRDLIRTGKTRRLLVQERLNPATGGVAGHDPAKRQILTLREGNAGAETVQDPLTSEFLVRVSWREEDALRANYCFTVQCAAGKVEDVSLFHGNLVQVFHGEVRETIFEEPSGSPSPGAFPYQRDDKGVVVCRLPPEPLAYRETPLGGELPPQSTLAPRPPSPDAHPGPQVRVQTTAGQEFWDEQPDLVHSDDTDEQGDHFVVETDERGRSRLRFGDGVNGRRLPDGGRVVCRYQVGLGLEGNVGADSIARLASSLPLLSQARCWNPFDFTNGRAPEPVAKIIRRAPEMFRVRQLRAVTLADYVRRAEELPEVSRAAAAYAWTGSWRTVRIAIDPAGSTTFDETLRSRLARHLDAVRLIGEDLELRPPLFVPLEIHVSLCVDSGYWPQDVRSFLDQEFSTGFTPDGRRAFFHPDAWTFGQALHASEILGRLQAVPGVEHVRTLSMKRWNDPAPAQAEVIKVRGNEIILVAGDPDRMEEGFIDFDLRGGRG